MAAWPRRAVTGGSGRTPADPNADPAVQAAYAAYLDVLTDPALQLGVSECSAAQAAEAQEAQYRLYEADKAHSAAWHAVNGSAPPGTAADWQARYPLLNMEHRGVPTPYDLGLSADRSARDEPQMEPEAGL
jgi:hypothetical protein